MTQTVAPPPAVTSSGSPYIGLGPYDRDDADFFFGREREVDLISANLMASRLTILYGPSGVGKSSVLRAGVLRHLTERARRETAHGQIPDFVPAIYSSWKQDPMTGLTRVVMAALEKTAPEAAEASTPATSLDEALERWADASTADLLLLLDQFEELFLYHDHQNGGATPFDEQLAAAVTRTDLQVNVLLSLREDALAKLDRYKRRIPRLFQNYLRMEPLRGDQAREAIVGPVERYNAAVDPSKRVNVEPVLVDAVLAAVGPGQALTDTQGAGVVASDSGGQADDAIETSHLQLVMTRLWSKEHGEDSLTLRSSTLVDLGGAVTIVRNHFDEVMARFDPSEQDLAAAVLNHLVTPTGSKIAHTVTDLTAWADVPEAALRPVLDKLAGQDVRILRHVPPPLERPDAVSYEIFHDVLAAAALDWRGRHTQASELRRLDEERRRAEHTAVEQRRRARVSIVLAVAAAVACIVAVGFFISADDARRTAEAAERTAQAERRTAEEAHKGRELAETVARQGLSAFSDPAQRLTRAADAVREAPTSELSVEMLRRLLGESLERTRMVGHTEQIVAVSASPEGDTVLTSARDGTVRLWDAGTGQELWSVAIPGINWAEFNADGSLVAVAGYDGGVYVYDSATGTRVHHFSGAHPGQGGATRVAFAPGSEGPPLLASAGVDGRVRVWNLASGTAQRFLKPRHEGPVWALTFSPDGTHLLSGGDGGVTRAWDVTGGDTIAVLRQDDPVGIIRIGTNGARAIVASGETAVVWSWLDDTTVTLGEHPHMILDVAFDPTGTAVATTSGKQVYLWDAATGERREEFRGHLDWVNTVDFDPDGRRIVTASGDGTARVWDVATARPLYVLRGHAGDVVGAELDARERIVTAGVDGTARVWALPEGRRFEDFAAWVLDAAFSPSGDYVAGAGQDGMVRVWDAATGSVEQTFQASDLPSTTVGFSPDGRFLITGGDDGYVRIWDWRDPEAPLAERLLTTNLTTGSRVSGSFSPTDPDVAVVAGTTGATVWHWRDDRESRSLVEDVHITAATFDADGARIALGDEFGNLMLYTTDGHPLEIALEGHRAYVVTVAFPANSRRLLTAGRDGTTRIWDLRSGGLVRELTGTQDGNPTTAVSDDGRFVATAAPDGTVAIWGARNGDLLAHVRVHADYVNAVAFKPGDPRSVITASDDHTVFLYRCETCGDDDELLQLAGRRLERILEPPTPAASQEARMCLLEDGQEIDCAQPHDYEYFPAPENPAGAGSPFDQAPIEAYANDQCTGAAFETYVGRGYSESRYYATFVTPDQAAWTSGERWVSCLLYLPEEQMVGSAQGSGE